MDNEPNGFKKLSEAADDMSVGEGKGNIADGVEGAAEQVDHQLRSVGIDAGDSIEIAKQRADDFQKMVTDEIRERPLRALGWAAAAGFVLGIMSAR